MLDSSSSRLPKGFSIKAGGRGSAILFLFFYRREDLANIKEAKEQVMTRYKQI